MSSFSKKYKVLGKVGEGSFAEVLKCQERSTGICYAAKRLKKVKESMDEALTSREIRTLEQLKRHPNILYMVEKHVDPLPGKMTIIFELMDMSLYDIIKTRKRPIPEIRCKDYLYQILKGLSHLHRNGIFHRDIKPENVLLKGTLVKIADLGSVKGMYQRQPHTEYISTRWYRAPECLLTRGIYGPKMDIWAAGCVYYELLTLRPLFPGSNEVDMITKIHNIMGTPSARTIAKFKRSRNADYWFPSRPGIGLCSMLPNVSEAGRDIFKQMLVYDPDLRSNVRRLLDHRYFNDLRELDESPHRRSFSEDRPPRMVSKPREWRNPMILSYITEKRRKTKRIHKKNTITEPPEKVPRVIVSNPNQQPIRAQIDPLQNQEQQKEQLKTVVKQAATQQKQLDEACSQTNTLKSTKSVQKQKEKTVKEKLDSDTESSTNRLPPIQKPIRAQIFNSKDTERISSLSKDMHSQSLHQDPGRTVKVNSKSISDHRSLPPIQNRHVQPILGRRPQPVYVRPPPLNLIRPEPYKPSDRLKNEQLVATLTRTLFHQLSNTNTSVQRRSDMEKAKSSSYLRLPPIVPKKSNLGESIGRPAPSVVRPKALYQKSSQLTVGNLPQRLETIQEQPYQLNKRMNLRCP